MYPSPVSPIAAAAFALPDLVAVFATPVFTPLVVVLLLLECFFFVSGCILLWELARPLKPRTSFSVARAKQAMRPAPASTALKFNAPPLKPGMLLQKHLGRVAGFRAAARSLPEEPSTTKAE